MADATDFDLLKISDIEEPEGPASSMPSRAARSSAF